MEDNMNREIKTISDLIDAIAEEMVRLDYKPTVVKQYHIVWNKLRRFAGEESASEFDMEFGMSFLEEAMRTHFKHLNGNSRHRWRKAIYLLSDYKRTGIITLRKNKREYVYAENVRKPIQLYIAHLEAIGRSTAHIRDVGLYLERLSAYLHHVGLEDITEMGNTHIHGYVNSLAVYEIPTIYHALCALRGFLRHLCQNSIIADDLSACVPTVKYSKKAKIPSAYARDEIERLIGSIDRGNPRGKRDYALILLAARLGLRASDIASLTFSSFRWDKNTIEIVCGKTGAAATLPLLNDVGEAVIDYIRYARPRSDTHFLFLKLNAPNDVMFANSIHHTVYTRLKEAGIRIPPGKKHGPHALRHSLASALLDNNVPMPVISEALIHADIESTSAYLKIDISKLRECAAEVPSFCRGHESWGVLQ
jgi:site-specific recombinase XerD